MVLDEATQADASVAATEKLLRWLTLPVGAEKHDCFPRSQVSGLEG